MSTETIRLIRKGASVDVKVGSDESHFNVSFNKVTRHCPQTTTFEAEKGEPKRIRTEAPLLTSLTPYVPLGQIGSRSFGWFWSRHG